MILLALMAAAAVAAPPTEAERLGTRLARTGMLNSVAAMATANETEEMIRDHPRLTPEQQARLRALGKEISTRHRDTLAKEMGRGYAKALSIVDLRALVAFQESAPALHWRAAMPGVLGGTMKTLGQIDFKGDLTKAFCADDAAACADWKK